jgi:hypothetical protein
MKRVFVAIIFVVSSLVGLAACTAGDGSVANSGKSYTLAAGQSLKDIPADQKMEIETLIVEVVPGNEVSFIGVEELKYLRSVRMVQDEPGEAKVNYWLLFNSEDCPLFEEFSFKTPITDDSELYSFIGYSAFYPFLYMYWEYRPTFKLVQGIPAGEFEVTRFMTPKEYQDWQDQEAAEIEKRNQHLAESLQSDQDKAALDAKAREEVTAYLNGQYPEVTELRDLDGKAWVTSWQGDRFNVSGIPWAANVDELRYVIFYDFEFEYAGIYEGSSRTGSNGLTFVVVIDLQTQTASRTLVYTSSPPASIRSDDPTANTSGDLNLGAASEYIAGLYP